MPAEKLRVERELVPSQPHHYAVPAPRPTFLNLRVDADPKMGLEASILDGRDRELAVARLPPGGGPRHILITQLEAGAGYRLRVTSRIAGKYELRVNSLRPAMAGDRGRIEGLVPLYLARTLFARGHPRARYREALELLRQAERELAEIDRAYHAYTILQQANAHLYLQENDAALERLVIAERRIEELQAAAVDDSQPYLRWLAEAYGAHAGILRQAGNSADALRLFSRAVGIYEEGGPEADWGLALFLNNRAFAQISIGLAQEAEDDFLRSIEVAGRQTRLRWLGWVALVNLADLYRRQGRMADALIRFQDAERQLAGETPSYPFEELLLSTSLGRFYLVTGRLDEARELLDRALILAREQEDREHEQKVLQSLALLHKAVGDLEGSLPYYEQAVASGEEIDSAALTAESLLEWGHTLRTLNNESEATDRFSRALAITTDSKNPALRVHSSVAITRDLLVRGLTKEAIVESARAVDTARDNARGLLATSLIVHGEALIMGGRAAEAETHLSEALTLCPEDERPLQYAEVRVWTGRAARAQGHLEVARSSLADGLRVIENLRGSLHQPATRTRFLGQRLDIYDELVGVLVELNRRDGGSHWISQAVEVSERSRSRTMADLLTRTHIDFQGHGIDPKLAEQEELYRDVLSLYYEALSRAPSVEEEGRAATLSRSFSQAQEVYEEVERKIREKHPSYAELRYAEPLGMGEMLRMVSPGTALLQYSVGREHSYLFVLRSDAPPSVFELPGEEVLQRKVSQVVEGIKGWDIRTLNRMANQTRDLYELLLGPAEGDLTDVEHLKILPDGALYALPFGMLLNPEGGYAIQRWAISYAPSVTVMAALQKRHRPSQWSPSLVAFAGPQGNRLAGNGATTDPARGPVLSPLPGSIEEARSIARHFPDQSHVYLGLEAHQDNVLRNDEVSMARWVHFASHGLIDEERPMNSAILLSPNSEGDDLLQVSEVFGLRLSSEVVVLSACRTGLGKRIAGEGILGLSRAFFYAGSQNVVVSLWAVSDRSTAGLMESFYAGMAQGDTPASSLRQAKLKLINEGHAPRSWAPFIITGATSGPEAAPGP